MKIGLVGHVFDRGLYLGLVRAREAEQLKHLTQDHTPSVDEVRRNTGLAAKNRLSDECLRAVQANIHHTTANTYSLEVLEEAFERLALAVALLPDSSLAHFAHVLSWELKLYGVDALTKNTEVHHRRLIWAIQECHQALILARINGVW